jgi:hypothetical protein
VDAQGFAVRMRDWGGAGRESRTVPLVRFWLFAVNYGGAADNSPAEQACGATQPAMIAKESPFDVRKAAYKRFFLRDHETQPGGSPAFRA